MANDFLAMVTRVTTELRRTNLVTEAKQAINDAISEAAKTRFYFNGMRDVSFVTVPGIEYYDDLGLTEIDTMWFTQGITRYNLNLDNRIEADDRAEGNNVGGQLLSYQRSDDQKIRLYPVPNTIVTVTMDGYGKLTPNPLVADADTNAWMTVGERYIRHLAKSIMLKEVIRDYGEARAVEAMADDLKGQLELETGLRLSTGTVRATQW